MSDHTPARDDLMAGLFGPGYWQEASDQPRADALNAKAFDLRDQAAALIAQAEALEDEAAQYERHWVSTGPGILDRLSDTSTPFLRHITMRDFTDQQTITWGMAHPMEDTDQ